jgi:hypothetical protein
VLELVGYPAIEARCSSCQVACQRLGQRTTGSPVFRSVTVYPRWRSWSMLRTYLPAGARLTSSAGAWCLRRPAGLPEHQVSKSAKRNREPYAHAEDRPYPLGQVTHFPCPGEVDSQNTTNPAASTSTGINTRALFNLVLQTCPPVPQSGPAGHDMATSGTAGTVQLPSMITGQLACY